MNVSALTLKQLRAFVAIARLGTLTAAADELSLTKAAVSVALQELEKQLGQPLFDRLKNRLVLNAHGKQLRPLADELLQRLLTIESLFDQGNLAGKLNIGASFTIGEHLLPMLVGSFMQAHDCQRPHLDVENTSHLCKLLERFELDMAFVEGQITSTALQAVPWRQDQMLVIAAPGHPLADKTGIALSALEDQHWILREAFSGTREQFDRRLAPLLDNWQLALELNTNSAVISAVASGIGLGFVSDLAAADALCCGRIVKLDLQASWTRQLHLVCAREKYQTPLMSSFIDYALQWRQ